MRYSLTYINLGLLFIFLITLNSCGMYRPVDAKEYPPEPEKRIAKNLEEGRGFRVFTGKKNTGEFDFASSNELWRATLDTIDFMPLVSANYSGGIIITDWYSDNSSANTSIKVSVRFLSNEIRVDALDVKVFQKNCKPNFQCKISETGGDLVAEIKKNILKKATIYKKQNKDKNFKKYKAPNSEASGDSGIKF